MSPSYKIGRVQALLVVLFAVNALFTAAAQELKESPKPEAVVSPSAPVPALDPAATSPSSLEVTYRDGLLTIDAHNSSLADVLTAVAEKTGVAIDVPPSAASLERIVEHSGPGPATDVLSRLLNGSAFDFVIVGSPQAPHTPTRILLMVHASTTPATPSLPEPSVASAAGPNPGPTALASASVLATTILRPRHPFPLQRRNLPNHRKTTYQARF